MAAVLLQSAESHLASSTSSSTPGVGRGKNKKKGGCQGVESQSHSHNILVEPLDDPETGRKEVIDIPPPPESIGKIFSFS